MEDNEFYPLFVDLDGTYTKTDLLFESFIAAFKQNPLILFYSFFWLFKGKSYIKYQLSKHADIDVINLPLNTEFFSFLQTEKSKGRRIYLATASNERYAQEVVNHHKVFDDYISSNQSVNLKGKDKLKKIKEISPRFLYAGNDAVDFDIFAHAEESVLVNPSYNAQKKATKFKVDKTFDVSPTSIKVWFKQLRVHQWLKNLLIFVPLMVSGGFTDINNITTAVYAFFAFSFLASATYILNDLLDLESDRAHSQKKFRPLAAGTISIKNGVLAGFILLLFSFAVSVSLGSQFSIVLLAYLSLTVFYSIKLKQHVAMDVVALALLFTIRILAGAAAIGVVVSFWLLAFSIFIFLSLALVKRCSEIQSMESEGKQRAKGRDYTINDYAILNSFGASSALLSVLMFCFYINNNVLTNQYQHPNILWLIVPALCYWLMRMWIKTHRGEMHHDPIVFSMKDKGSLATIGFCGLVAIAAQLL
ncbi:UbiA family prenyltransferase [Vibrio japonicus]|uniref:UbiA family prenyltransferase n=1 Tax=Vibrio japonicus TaxID=1824638 RepID=A0ABY5LM66_9VIBR|nr:UbiA family prenyltransferase [Vibrio japonicus]UUM32245.1 UbiA family prenyltransferase [Vibrio japonicus]